jgi:uncharacterized protein YjbI with pentapeptide repeats
MVLPLEDEVQALLEQPGPAFVALGGGPGSGKTQALAHLAAVFAHSSRLRLVDEGELCPEIEHLRDEVVIVVPSQGSRLPIQKLLLAPWQRDDLIEYLLARHPKGIASAMARVSNSDIQEFKGNPEVLRIVLDELVRDEGCPDAAQALMRDLRSRIVSDELWDRVSNACLGNYAFAKAGLEDVVRLLFHEPIRRLVVAEHLATQLKRPGHEVQLPAMPRVLVRAVGRRIEANEIARSKLHVAMRSEAEQPMAASVLSAMDATWKPPRTKRLNLKGAYLDKVSWPGVRLCDANLSEADLSHADLSMTILDDSKAERANLSRALLTRASLSGFDGTKANLTSANLLGVQGTEARFSFATMASANLDEANLFRATFQGTDLKGATFRRANLHSADLVHAKIQGADFSGANLSHALLTGLPLRLASLDDAVLCNAVLNQANLEGMQLDGINLAGAELSEALLTGTSMRGADLSECVLHQAGLADVDWENACLRGADLRWASFHLGSSRSGLVGSPIASEGSRTGFYTDDFGEQDFKPPEEIRKANLRNADLRGAIIDGVDFYLVDLRGAKYDPRQAEHFRRCGAILEDRCPQ